MFKLFLVGGFIRDRLLDTPSKDIDFSVVCQATHLTTDEAFAAMRTWLEDVGIEIFLETPEFATIRGRFPNEVLVYPRWPLWQGMAADFVLARRDGPSSDSRRPDWVEVGTLEDDLARRDFTVNALAEGQDGSLIDLFGGEADLRSDVLRFVGDPMERIGEDALRIMRGFRFMVTKGLVPTAETWEAMVNTTSAMLLMRVSDERRQQELDRMLSFDTLGTLDLLADLPSGLRDAMFAGRVRLSCTLKQPST